MEKTSSINSQHWKIELLSILVTAILVVIFMLPIFRNVPDFPFMFYNIAAIAIFVTLIRYIFLLRFTPFARSLPIKVILTFAALGVFAFLMDGLSLFQNTLDEEGTYSMVSHLNIDQQLPLSKYIRSEMIFFGVGALISTIILPFRMIISIWRVKNRNTV